MEPFREQITAIIYNQRIGTPNIQLVFVVQTLKACKIALGDFLGVFSPDCCRVQSQFVL